MSILRFSGVMWRRSPIDLRDQFCELLDHCSLRSLPVLLDDRSQISWSLSPSVLFQYLDDRSQISWESITFRTVGRPITNSWNSITFRTVERPITNSLRLSLPVLITITEENTHPIVYIVNKSDSTGPRNSGASRTCRARFI